MINEIIQHLKNSNLSWIATNLEYCTIMGSRAYGTNREDSDYDIYGFCSPPKEYVFPFLNRIPEFENQQINNFHVYTSQFEYNGKQVDLNIYNIVNYFRLVKDANPNMQDSLFTDKDCIIYSTKIGDLIKENRKMFLSKKCYWTFKGYAEAQQRKIINKNNSANPKRAADIAKYGFDTKFAGHLVRLCLECEQILELGNMHLKANASVLTSIRNGIWSLETLLSWFKEKMKYLEGVYNNSTLPHTPRESEIRKLLAQCLKIKYGNISWSLDSWLV